MSRLSVLALALLCACGTAPGRNHEPSTKNRGTDVGLYQGEGMVLENGEHGPELCLGGVYASLPPQCGGLPITNWAWDKVAGEESAGASTWGDYHVIGSYDGHDFTVVEVSALDRSGADPDPIGTPCPEPDGGWSGSDLTQTTEQNLQGAIVKARSEPDFSGVWVGTAESGPMLGETILNLAFTGDIERHRTSLSARWGGPLCVVERSQTLQELRHIQSELTDGAAVELGLDVLWAATHDEDNVVELGVVIIDDEGREALDARYGEGTVRVFPALTPVDA